MTRFGCRCLSVDIQTVHVKLSEIERPNLTRIYNSSEILYSPTKYHYFHGQRVPQSVNETALFHARLEKIPLQAGLVTALSSFGVTDVSVGVSDIGLILSAAAWALGASTMTSSGVTTVSYVLQSRLTGTWLTNRADGIALAATFAMGVTTFPPSGISVSGGAVYNLTSASSDGTVWTFGVRPSVTTSAATLVRAGSGSAYMAATRRQCR